MIGEKLWYAISFLSEALTVWLYFDYLFPRKKRSDVISLTFATGYIVLYFISQLNNTTFNAITCCIVNYTLIRFNYQCNKKNAILHVGFLCFVMTCAEILSILVNGVRASRFEFAAHTNDLYSLILLTILSKMLYLAFSVLGSRIFAPKKHNSSEPHFMVLFCCLPIISAFIAVFTVYYGMSLGATAKDGVMMLVTVLSLLVVNLISLVLYDYFAKANEEYLTLQLSIQKEQADIAYYEVLQEQYENQRILVHDIKKHLGIIEALARQGCSTEIEEYISGLNVSFDPTKQAKLCTDSILNLLLIHFRNECKEAGVDFQCDVRENISEFMEASSVTTLYGNLLSNALESAAHSKEKRVELSVSWHTMQSVVVISVINTCDTAPIPNGHGYFDTSKKDKSVHGVGLRSIERIVKKYHGIATMYYNRDEKQFHHVIQFPGEQS